MYTKIYINGELSTVKQQIPYNAYFLPRDQINVLPLQEFVV
jgi:hypothetical protein